MTTLAATLPALALGLIWWLLSAHRSTLGLGRLAAAGTLAVAFVSFEGLLVAVTETLSIGAHLTTPNATWAWLFVDVALGVLLVVTVGRDRLTGQLARWRPSTVLERIRDAPRSVVLGVTTIALVIAVLAVVSALYLPNTTDSLVYHLPRVPQWIDNGSVRHFATHYTAQDEFSPLHEYNLLHLHLLAGTDRLDNFVQLVAFVVCLAGVAEIARLLGARVETQISAALICAVIPSAVLQATGTKNDILAAAIGVALFVLLLAWVPLGRLFPPVVFIGLAAGLGAIVKGVLPLLLAPALGLLVVRQVLVERGQSSWRRALLRTGGALIVAAVAAALVAGPFLKRNHDLFGSFTGPVSDSTINEDLSGPNAIGNVIRSIAVNFRFGDGRSGVDTLVQQAALPGFRELYDAIGASQQDPRFVIGALDDAFRTGDYQVLSRYEEYGANGWHVILLVLTGGLYAVWVARGERWARLPALIAGGLVIGFILFFATARWSLFVARYQIPLLVAWAPLIALALDRIHRYVLRIAVGALVLAAAPQLLDNATRPLLDPHLDFASDIHGYFVHAGGDGYFVAPEDYVRARDAIVASGCERLGIGNWILLEYPVWAGLEHAGWDGTIKHIDVDNATGALEDVDFHPCAVLRQTVNRPPASPPEGWVDLPLGGLSLWLEPDAA